MGHSATIRGVSEAAKIEAGLCIAGKLPDVEKHYDEQTLDAAHRSYRGQASIQRLIYDAAVEAGWKGSAYDVTADLPNALKAAFSTVALPGALGNAANKFILSGYLGVEQTWRKIVNTRPAKDFKPTTGYRLTGDMKFERISPDGEIKHGKLGEVSYTNRAATFGRMFGLTRTDIFNDDVGVIAQAAKGLGRGAGLALNHEFWTLFLNNSLFFTVGRGNYLSGSTTNLSLDSLAVAEAAFADQKDEDGNPLGIEPRYLLVPTALKVLAQQIYTSTKLAGGATATPEDNPFSGKFEPLSSAYLGNANYAGNSSKAWYLLADPDVLPVIDAVFLGGREEPTVESADADFDRLGISWRGYLDFGFAFAEHRGGVKVKGEA